MTDPYEILANAIVLQAVKDYRDSLKRLKKKPSNQSAMSDAMECERFFRSAWYKTLKQLQANIAKAVVSADTLSPDGIQARLEELQKELIKKANNKQDYDAIADEILRLREQKEQSEVDSHHREEAMNRIKELQDFISKQKTDITEFDEALVKKLIEKITVFADHFTVKFKSGLAIDIEE